MGFYPQAVIFPLIALNEKGSIVGVSFLNLRRRLGDNGYEAEFGIGVSELYRGSGVGSELTRSAIKFAGIVGIRRICLTVLSSNASAIRLYKKYGFEQLEEMKKGDRWRGRTYDCIRMSLDLSR